MKHLRWLAVIFYLYFFGSSCSVKYHKKIDFKFLVGQFDIHGDSAKKVKNVVLGLDFNIGFKNVTIRENTLSGMINYYDPESSFRNFPPKQMYIYQFNDFSSLNHLRLIDSVLTDLSGAKFSIIVKKNENYVFITKKYNKDYYDAGYGLFFQLIQIN
jgi:hypothetical protein